VIPCSQWASEEPSPMQSEPCAPPARGSGIASLRELGVWALRFVELGHFLSRSFDKREVVEIRSSGTVYSTRLSSFDARGVNLPCRHSPGSAHGKDCGLVSRGCSRIRPLFGEGGSWKCNVSRDSGTPHDPVGHFHEMAWLLDSPVRLSERRVYLGDCPP
jgi:hypothetical protein